MTFTMYINIYSFPLGSKEVALSFRIYYVNRPLNSGKVKHFQSKNLKRKVKDKIGHTHPYIGCFLEELSFTLYLALEII